MLLLLSAVFGAPAAEFFVYLGTYTGPLSKGIYVCRFDTRTGKLSAPELAAETTNPSFLAITPDGRYLYAVSEAGRAGAVSAFARDPQSGSLKLLNTVASEGSGPCFVSIDKTSRYVLVANYNSGSIAALPIQADGSLAKASAVVQHTGSSVNPKRQQGPHAHSINPSPDNRFAVAADLGLDKLLIYRFDPAKGSLAPNDPPFTQVNPGAGPRHFAFHPRGRFAYVISEMQSTVTAFAWDGSRGALKELQTITTLPKDFSGENSTAEVQVHPSGRFLYGSNRGHDSIAVFAIDSGKGTLTPVEHVSTQGRVPRNFAIDPTGEFLIAANQRTNNVVVFRIDQKTGRLTPAGSTVETGSPVCVKFVAVGKGK